MKKIIPIVIIAAVSIGSLMYVWSLFNDTACTTSGRGDPHMPILQMLGGKQMKGSPMNP